MHCEKECPICYEIYGEQEDGNFLCKDGKCNSGYETECKHYICVKCCKTLRNKFIEDEDEDEEEEDEEKKVRCPLCREDWTDWIGSHYCTTDEETDYENDETDYETDEDNFDYENSADGYCVCCKKPSAECRYLCSCCKNPLSECTCDYDKK